MSLYILCSLKRIEKTNNYQLFDFNGDKIGENRFCKILENQILNHEDIQPVNISNHLIYSLVTADFFMKAYQFLHSTYFKPNTIKATCFTTNYMTNILVKDVLQCH